MARKSASRLRAQFGVAVGPPPKLSKVGRIGVEMMRFYANYFPQRTVGELFTLTLALGLASGSLVTCVIIETFKR